MKRWRPALYVAAVIFVAVVALTLRLRAVRLLPVDYDEDDYLGAGQRYAQFIRAGDLAAVSDYDYNYEHPPLTKLVYAAALLPLPDAALIPQLSPTEPPADSLPQPHFRVARTISAVFGALEALALALLNPLAGLFLAIFTWQIKYTSQIMLEPLPALTSLLMVLCYVKARNPVSGRNRVSLGWLLLSAVALGLTVASKYTYGVAAVAILVDWLWTSPPTPLLRGEGRAVRIAPLLRGEGQGVRSFVPLLLWGFVAIAVFFAFDPHLWADPFGRLSQSLLYHGGYAQSEQVRRAGFPAWQPLVWLFGPVPWHPGVFVVGLDFFITLLAALGLKRLWRGQRVFALWLAIGLGFLLVWPTKWPQYVLTITAPLTLAAAEGFRGAVWAPLARWIRGLRAERRPADPVETRVGRRDARRAAPWLLPGLLALSLIVLFPLLYQAAMALTDFNAISIRDGIQGGVWRAVWQGLTGQVKPVVVEVFESGERATKVQYAGPALLLQLFSGAVPDLLVFNVLWTVLSVALQAALGIGVALMLHRQGVRFRGWWRTIFILPWAIPEFVGALVWLRIFEPDFGWLALAQNVPTDVRNLSNWFENPNSTLAILLVAAIWLGFPFIMLATTAALKLIPVEVYDAAALDGAAGWRLFRSVTWPLVLPLVAPALIIRAIFAFNQFYLFYTMRTNPPLMTFATASYYLFSPSGYFGGQFAVSAALNIFTVIVLIVLILWFNRWSKAAEGVTYA
jgi:ABC-type sugar transport system permease subunit